MKDKVFLVAWFSIPTVLAFQYGRYRAYGTIFGYKTERYYRIEEAEKRL